ncbi:probable plastid-lipid-associated protein 13, chloroplastic [Impatiens glandulifera]|uniref:probable plastid-lipid-associated protein 13, chloroplastic n=1 Tax=Impatiens glandulifera TaxID=253017 RepID=UPI001FB104FE|nr:probable plastid-lipid-associated protein 13, chloroplastic [Impatiens glandulifera]
MASSLLGPAPVFHRLRSNDSRMPNCSPKLFFFTNQRQFTLRATAQPNVQGASVSYAREMERLSAKESLLIAFKDSGGFDALATGKTTDMQRIDVNERIIALERVNPTLRPTTSPFLEGRWNFEWFGSGTPGFFAAKLVFERFPSTLANIKKMDVFLKDGYAKITTTMRVLNSIDSKFGISSKLSIEGPLRMKEEYIEGLFETPKIDEAALPEQLRGALNQAVSSVQQLPLPIRDVIASGLKLPLSGTYQRLFLISYLDEEILIIRDTSGVPEVLTRLEGSPPPLEASATDYES